MLYSSRPSIYKRELLPTMGGMVHTASYNLLVIAARQFFGLPRKAYMVRMNKAVSTPLTEEAVTVIWSPSLESKSNPSAAP